MKLESYSSPITGQILTRSAIPSKYLEKPRNTALLRYALEEWGLLGISFTGLVLGPLWLKAICLIVFGGRLHALGVIVHDISHQSLRKKTPLMRVVEIMTGYLIGTTANAMAYHHNRHHRHVNTSQDPYFKLNKKCGPIKRIFMTIGKGSLLPYSWLLRAAFAPVAHMLPGLRTIYGRVFLQDVSGKDLSDHPEILSCIKEDYYLLAFHSLLLTLAFTALPVLKVYYLCLPLAGMFCIYRLLIEHEYEVQDSTSMVSIIGTTFDHHNSWPWRVFLTPRHIGYHIAHHLHASAALETLPEIREWYLQNFPEIYK